MGATYGRNLRLTIFGESHGKGIGKNQRRREATGKMTAAPIIVKSFIFHMAGIIRMAGAHGVL